MGYVDGSRAPKMPGWVGWIFTPRTKGLQLGPQRPSGLTSIVQGVHTSPPNPLSTLLGQFPMGWNRDRGRKSVLGRSGSKWPLNPLGESNCVWGHPQPVLKRISLVTTTQVLYIPRDPAVRSLPSPVLQCGAVCAILGCGALTAPPSDRTLVLRRQ